MAKDPGYSPQAILEQAARTARYVQPELDSLAFDGPAPDAALLAQEWHGMLAAARDMVGLLPAAEAGKLVLQPDGSLFRGDVDALRAALAAGGLRFHEGRLRGAYPQLKG